MAGSGDSASKPSRSSTQALPASIGKPAPSDLRLGNSDKKEYAHLLVVKAVQRHRATNIALLLSLERHHLTPNFKPLISPRWFFLGPLLLWAAHLFFLSLFPSQDGPSHLLTGQTLMDCFQGIQPTSSLYAWKVGQGTNQLSSFLLGFFLLLGMRPHEAESLFQLILLFLLLETGRRLLEKLRASPATLFLLLLPFAGRVLHWGFYNFMLSVFLGILAWTLRKPRARNLASDLCFLLALYAHPLGALTFFGLVTLSPLGPQSLKRFLFILPHLLLFLWVSMGNLGGKPLLGYKPGFPQILGQLWILEKDSPLRLLSGIFLLSLLLVSVLQWKSFEPLVQTRRKRFLLGGLFLLLLTSLAPDKMHLVVELRLRAGFLGWILLLFALAPPSRIHPRTLAWILYGSATALLAFAMRVDHRLETQLKKELKALPPIQTHQSVLTGFHLYEPQTLLLVQGFHPEKSLSPQPGRLLSIEKEFPFNPWLHILDRWALQHGAVSVANHQSLYPHSPLKRSFPFHRSWQDLLEYNCGLAPLEQLKGAARYILFANLDSDWLQYARPRIPKAFRIASSGRDWVLLKERDWRPTLSSPFFKNPVSKVPLPYVLPKDFSGGILELPQVLASKNADFPFQVFCLDSLRKTYRSPSPSEIQPNHGRFDGKGKTAFQGVHPKNKQRFILVPR